MPLNAMPPRHGEQERELAAQHAAQQRAADSVRAVSPLVEAHAAMYAALADQRVHRVSLRAFINDYVTEAVRVHALQQKALQHMERMHTHDMGMLREAARVLQQLALDDRPVSLAHHAVLSRITVAMASDALRPEDRAR